MTSANLPAVRLAMPVATRPGSAITMRVRLPFRRSITRLAVTTSLALSSGTAGAATLGHGSNLGGWLIVGAGAAGVSSLLQAADLHRSRS